MSIDYRDAPQPVDPVLTTIHLDDGHVEISASSMTQPEDPSQSGATVDPSTTSSSDSPPSFTPTPSPTHAHDSPGHTNVYVPQVTTSSALRISTVTYMVAVETSPTTTVFPTSKPGVASSGSTIDSHAIRGLSLVGVVALPILVLIVLSSMVLLCCRARQRRKARSRRGEQGKPPRTSVFTSLKRSFSEQQKTPSVQHTAYFPAVTVSRDPSPTPETRGRPNTQFFSPQPRDTLVSDPPPPYVLRSDSLRPPSMYGRIHTRSPSPTLSEATLSVHDDATLRSPFGSPYLDVESDALSDFSIERGYSLRRQRDTDEVSFVSALEPDEHVERDLHYVV